MRQLERTVVLSVIDNKWREHLAEMDYLRSGIGLRAMGQRDPLVEYQREGFAYFEELVDSVKHDATRYMFHVDVVQKQQAAAGIGHHIFGEVRPADEDEAGRPVRREGRPERAVSVRIRQEVQALSRRRWGRTALLTVGKPGAAAGRRTSGPDWFESAPALGGREDVQ